jgi:hypothetical protein
MMPPSSSRSKLLPVAEKHKLSRRRSIAVWTLIVVASVVTLLMVMTFWLKRQVLDNDSWRKASTELVQNQDVQNSVSTLVVNQLYENVDVGQALSDRLPEQVKALGPTLAAVVRQPATNAVEALLDRPKIQQLFVEASSGAQQKLVNVLEDKTGYGISTGNGEVTIDLHQLVVELGTTLGISQERLDKLPAKAGVINLMSSDQLGAAQKGVKLVHVISGFFVILVLALYALAVYLARGRRRETLRNVGWAFIVVSVLTLALRRFTGNYVVDALTESTGEKPVRAIWLIGSSILGQIGRAGILYGAITVLGAVLAGPTRAATAVRRWLAPYLNDRPALVWTVLGAMFALVVLWGPTHALHEWWGIVIFGGLLAIGLAALRRETMKEFPSSRTEDAPPPATAPVSS